MSIRVKLTAQLALLWRFLGFFQSPLLRFLHAVVVILVLLQFLTKLFGLNGAHLVLGLVLSFAGLLLVGCGLWKHGPRHYFPYLWGDTDQLAKDVAAIRGGKLIIAPRPKGLATVVQGLGMGALTMSLLTGLWWFRAWQYGDISHAAAAVHKVFVWLLLAYAAGHGGMALAHFAFWQKAAGQKNSEQKS
jgi:hypothetical protein